MIYVLSQLCCLIYHGEETPQACYSNSKTRLPFQNQSLWTMSGQPYKWPIFQQIIMLATVFILGSNYSSVSWNCRFHYTDIGLLAEFFLSTVCEIESSSHGITFIHPGSVPYMSSQPFLVRTHVVTFCIYIITLCYYIMLLLWLYWFYLFFHVILIRASEKDLCSVGNATTCLCGCCINGLSAALTEMLVKYTY